MGRLIDETNLMNLLYALDDARHDLCYAIKKIPELPPVEAIPKDQYKARLNADLVAMLTEIQLEIEELDPSGDEWSDSLDACNDIIQQKIDKLKGKKNDKRRKVNK